MRGTRLETLPRLLERAASWHESKRVTHVDGRRTPASSTYGDLLARALAAARWLREHGVAPRDPVILAPERNEDFVRALWGCLLAGAVPVPLAAPTRGRTGPATERLAGVWRRLGEPRVVVGEADAATAGAVGMAGPAWPIPDPACLRLPSELPAGTPASVWDPRPGDTALIQFSSGSTGAPKGVVLTHENIVANLRAIRSGALVTPEDVGVSWTPLQHDLGLVGFLLGSISCPNDLVLIDTAAFVRRPVLWLDVLHDHRGTITAAPNFGQSLVLRRLGAGPWDLSCVRVLFNGAEPIAAGVMRAFMDALAPHGLRRESMFPVYGLAEAALAVTFPVAGEPPRVRCCDRRALAPGDRALDVEPSSAHAVEIVCVGSAVEGCRLRIVDDRDRPLDHGTVGHVQVRGSSVTAGYYDDPDATAGTFVDGWLRTGDLGFLSGGALYVTGRAKDVLFVNGQNLYASDVETVALRAEGAQGRRVAACAWRRAGDSADRLLLFVGSTRPDEDLDVFAAIQAELQATLGLAALAIVPLTPSAFPRTTSGKLQRHRLRERFERGELRDEADRVARLLAARGRVPAAAPRTSSERTVHAVWARELGLRDDEFGVHERFERLGGTSLTAVLIASALEERYGVALAQDLLTRCPTVATMAAHLDAHVAAGRPPAGRRQVFRG
jgi:acyl-CoA synthetase (AMP-forming)/AMP-acid ligase II/acyl carrier protein